MPDSFNPASYASENRGKVLANLRGLESGLSGLVYVKGFELSIRKWTDSELKFRQESNFCMSCFNLGDRVQWRDRGQ